jgi:hypothetical protein
MGGAVKSVAKVVTAPASLVTSAASAIPGVGKIAGPVAGYITGGPLGAAKAIAGTALTGGYSGGGGGGGGGGIPTYGSTDASGALTAPPPGFSFGSDLYSYGGEPYDASKYFVQGNKGVYNVLPELGNMYSPEAQAAQGTSGFNAYQNIYGKMAGDELAQANLQKSFSPGMLSVAPQSGAYKPIGDFNPATTPYAGGRADLPSYLTEDIKSAYGEYQPQAQSSGSSYLPIQYADFGFGEKDKAYELAQFARRENNPFFQPFASPTSTAAPTMANPFAFAKPPEAPAPAPSPYQPVEGGPRRGPAERGMVPATTASMGTFRPIEASSATPTTTATARRPEEYKPVNIRTGGLASLRRS